MVKCLSPGFVEQRVGDGCQYFAIRCKDLYIVTAGVCNPIGSGKRVEGFVSKTFRTSIGHRVEESPRARSGRKTHKCCPGLIRTKVCHHKIPYCKTARH